MARADFEKAVRRKVAEHQKLVQQKNRRQAGGNGIFERWANPVITAAHVPLFWRFDLDPRTNPFFEDAIPRLACGGGRRQAPTKKLPSNAPAVVNWSNSGCSSSCGKVFRIQPTAGCMTPSGASFAKCAPKFTGKCCCTS